MTSTNMSERQGTTQRRDEENKAEAKDTQQFRRHLALRPSFTVVLAMLCLTSPLKSLIIPDASTEMANDMSTLSAPEDHRRLHAAASAWFPAECSLASPSSAGTRQGIPPLTIMAVNKSFSSTRTSFLDVV